MKKVLLVLALASILLSACGFSLTPQQVGTPTPIVPPPGVAITAVGGDQPTQAIPAFSPTPSASPTASMPAASTANAVVEAIQALAAPASSPTPGSEGATFVYPGIIQKPDGNNHWVIAVGPMPENPKCRRDDNNVDERGGCDLEAWNKYLEMYKGKPGGPGMAWVADFTQAQALLNGNPLIRVLFSERCNLDMIDYIRPGECLVKLEDLPLLNASLALPVYDGTLLFTWDADYCVYNPWPKAENPCKHPSATPQQ